VGELVGRPGTDRRAPQPYHLPGGVTVAGGAQPAGELVAGSDELAQRPLIQRRYRDLHLDRPCRHPAGSSRIADVPATWGFRAATHRSTSTSGLLGPSTRERLRPQHGLTY
jgi:hypothetical protein